MAQVAFGAGRALRIAILSGASGDFDSRSHRIARSEAAAGHHVTIYSHWKPGLASEERRDEYRVVRVRFVPEPDGEAGGRGGDSAAHERPSGRGRRARPTRHPVRLAARAARRLLRRAHRSIRDRSHAYRAFVLQPYAWARALERTAEPADIWHGMWTGSLPALGRLKARHGGATVYDSRDITLRSRGFERSGALTRRLLLALERRWARRCDAAITVNDAYADTLRDLLRIPRPDVVMNCPERWAPPEVRPDLIREATGLPTSTRIVLYQGHLKSERGLDESLEAVMDVPDACLVLLVFGPQREHFAELATTERYREKLRVLDPVAPSELLRWTASADVAVMAIPDTSLNHRLTTPQKLFEAMAVGVPVVASDLPGMAAIIRETGCGELCNPASPASISAAIRLVLDAPQEARDAYGRNALRAAEQTYNWERQAAVLHQVYARILRDGAGRPAQKAHDVDGAFTPR